MRQRPMLTEDFFAFLQAEIDGAAGAEDKGQGLTLAHLSAQLKRFLWDRGCA